MKRKTVIAKARGIEINSTVPQYNGLGVDPHKEAGGKRKGRSMKRRPKTFKHAKVTMENMRTARDNGGYYDGTLKCVVYIRKDGSNE